MKNILFFFAIIGLIVSCHTGQHPSKIVKKATPSSIRQANQLGIDNEFNQKAFIWTACLMMGILFPNYVEILLINYSWAIALFSSSTFIK